MKNTNKLVALILALLLLVGSTAAFASTYVSDPISPSISNSSEGEDQPVVEATPEPLTSVEPAQTEQPAEVVQETEAVVTTDDENGNVNIRAAASADAEIIGQLTSNMRVSVLGVEGDWTKIRADSIVGYVYSKFLQVSAPEATPAPVEIKREVRITTTLGSVVNVGDPVTMNSELVGFDGLNVHLQWQQNTGFGWRDVSGANGPSFSYVASEETVNSQWRVSVTIVG
jgi:uncharacterized protein YgiM (DUF1202 family)